VSCVSLCAFVGFWVCVFGVSGVSGVSLCAFVGFWCVFLVCLVCLVYRCVLLWVWCPCVSVYFCGFGVLLVCRCAFVRLVYVLVGVVCLVCRCGFGVSMLKKRDVKC
jgi:hypothetical protein